LARRAAAINFKCPDSILRHGLVAPTIIIIIIIVIVIIVFGV
jgi:hypothetical protein